MFPPLGQSRLRWTLFEHFFDFLALNLSTFSYFEQHLAIFFVTSARLESNVLFARCLSAVKGEFCFVSVTIEISLSQYCS